MRGGREGFAYVLQCCTLQLGPINWAVLPVLGRDLRERLGIRVSQTVR